MSAKRMNRGDFFAELAPLGEDRLHKVLWNLYWRGSAAMRERIEDELDPAEQQRRTAAAAQPADPDLVLYEVREFAKLARAGAYIAGDRRVPPKERRRQKQALRRERTGPAARRRAVPASRTRSLRARSRRARDRVGERAHDPSSVASFRPAGPVRIYCRDLRAGPIGATGSPDL